MTDQELALNDASTSTPSPAWEMINESTLTLDKLTDLRRAAFQQVEHVDWLHEQVRKLSDTGADQFRKAMGNWVLGRHQDALRLFKGIKESPVTLYCCARSSLALGKLDDARSAQQKVLKTHAGATDLVALGLQILERAADWDGLKKALESAKGLDATAWGSYFRGRLAEAQRNNEMALDLYAQALDKDAMHAESLFRRAYLLDLGGLDEESIQCYERAIKCAPANLAAVVNLGLLYEDSGQFRKAMRLYDFALRAHPYHPRAQLYRRDSAASLNMFFDEDMEKREDKRNQVLRTPITDFELSVRSRNCLAKMNIKTLGDLVKKTEAELLSYKNFGETSLNEIKEILKSKGLRLGMDREDLMVADLGDKPSEEKAPSAVEGAGDVSQKPITELELSVRCRRAMDTLKIKVIGDLTHRTEAELLALPNFGQTSLNEIKTKLEELGLSLKG